MRFALKAAQDAALRGEVPVGAVLVCNGNVVAVASNRTILDQDATAHAEILAIRAGSLAMSNYRLTGATLYVTLEPCVMCAGALVHARVKRLVFGARDLRFGGVRSKFQLADHELLNHRVSVTEGVLGAECTALLQEFFQQRR